MISKNILLFLIVVGLFVVGHDRRAVADNWPGWRNDGSGVSADSTAPIEWSADSNILWKTPIPGQGHSSPIVWGDQVFVTTVRPTVERHWLAPASLIVLSLLCGLALWRLSDGTFGDPLGLRSDVWSDESTGAKWLRRIAVWSLFVLIGYGTITTVELGYDFLEQYPEAIRNRVIDKTWYFTDAPDYQELDTPISAFRVLTGKEVEGPFFGSPRIPYACYFGGILGALALLGVNSTLASRRRLATGSLASGQDAIPPKRLFRCRVNLLGLKVDFGVQSEKPFNRIVTSLVEWIAFIAAGCFLITVHSAAMADLPFVPGSTTWFLTVSIGVLGLIAFNLMLPARPLLRIAGILVTGMLLAYVISAAPPNEEFGLFATALRAGLKPLVKLLLVVLALGMLAAWVSPTEPARRGDAADSRRLWTMGLAALGVLLCCGIFFTLSNFQIPKNIYAREVVSIDRRSGALQWTARCDSAEITSRLHPANTMATPTPVTDGEHVFAHFGEAGLFCIDMKGNRKWKYEEPVPPSHWGAASSPILWRDLVIMTYDIDHQSMTVGIDKAVGAERWRSNRTSQIEPSQLYDAYSTPVIVQRNGAEELVHVACKLLMGYDPATGNERWTFAFPGEQPIATPVIFNDLMIVLGGKYAPYMGAVRVETSNGVATPHEVWQSKKSVSDMPSPVVYDGLVYMVTKDGIASCLDAQTGESKWRHRLRGAYWASVMAVAGHVYFCNASGTTTVIEAGPEFNELSLNELGENVNASFAVSNGEIFVRTADNLICIGADTDR